MGKLVAEESRPWSRPFPGTRKNARGFVAGELQGKFVESHHSLNHFGSRKVGLTALQTVGPFSQPLCGRRCKKISSIAFLGGPLGLVLQD